MLGQPSPAPASSIVTLRTAFFSGLLLLAPLWVTLWAFAKIVDLLGGTFRPLYEHLLPLSLQRIPFLWDLITTLVVLCIITLIGYFSRYVFGKYFLEVGERIIHGIPGVGHVYNTVKQLVETFGTKNRNVFSKVVLVQFPRQGTWTLGFLTNKAQGEAQLKTGAGELWSVFVPTTPNPTGGYLLMFPPQEVIELDMSVGDGMKMVISGGAVVPPWPPAKASN